MLRPSCVLTVFLLPFPAITATAYGVRVGWSELAVVLTFVLATAASILLANHVVLRALHASVVERLASAEPGEPLP